MGRVKIMIVEDDEDLHTLYGLYLQGEDYEILRAYNGQEAFRIMENEQPAVIILDMIMPVMDGEEFYVRLRTEKKMTEVPVIIASVNDKMSSRILALGKVYAILKKPFTIEVLVQHIKGALADTR